VAELTRDACCTDEQQAACCEPSEKADCCGEGCGCEAGASTQERERIRFPRIRPPAS
jgi:hypothetical protein